jgi:hypothetical protein
MLGSMSAQLTDPPSSRQKFQPNMVMMVRDSRFGMHRIAGRALLRFTFGLD